MMAAPEIEGDYLSWQEVTHDCTFYTVSKITRVYREIGVDELLYTHSEATHELARITSRQKELWEGNTVFTTTF